ncbi:heavy-metal-associated domain-containing protein [Rosistilla oblonga]|uniref:Mercuric transport protein periplasmic component n=1 Tax=Rosistilla oblonga TaxID=2527990 RepID=A0A518IVK6_9BACT|nr:heavy metal-associated domain-containing protein [Rosistilla oblonga]QDV57119.1 Mercuric transport protein periplasmic component precursor [Rosistilla oblonga]
MRFMVYVVAVLIAAGIVFVMGKPSETAQQSDPSVASSTTLAVDSGSDVDVQSVALSVPGMHCAFGCYPTVKEALESVDGVQGVELAEQKSETELDNKTVFVTFNNAFKLETALAKLEKAGFDATKIDAN